MSVFAIVFLFAVLAGLAVRTYLAWRQIRHVAAHRNAVPEPFHARIDDAAHRRAADYTIARVEARLLEMVVAAVWLLWLTLGGLLQDRLTETPVAAWQDIVLEPYQCLWLQAA